MGLNLFGGRKGKRIVEHPSPEESPPGPAAPREALELDRPLAGLAAAFMFPLAFQVGEVPVRVRPLRLQSGRSAFSGAPASTWFFWKAQTSSRMLSGFWHLPGPGGDEKVAEAWNKTAKILANAAAIKLRSLLSSLPETAPVHFSAGPCPEPALRDKAVLRLDFRYWVRGAYREGSTYSGTSYPHIAAQALGCTPPAARDDAIGALLAGSRAMIDAAPESYWLERAFSFAGSKVRHYLPVYELLNLLSDDDTRLVVQNNLVIKAPGASLGALFMYRKNLQSPEGAREYIVPPHSLDTQRVYPLFPESVFEDRRLEPATAAADLDDFLHRNDEAYEELFQAVRRDALSLSAEGTALIRSVYVAQVYSQRRRAFDTLVAAGKPFDEFKEFPERIARRSVDTNGAEPIAAAVYGSKEALAFVARWCSRRKQESIGEELKRIKTSLAEGVADLDALIANRLVLLEKAKAFVEAERHETVVPVPKGKKP